jgi:site-specific DNA-methyltransferase (adenine-specific)
MNPALTSSEKHDWRTPDKVLDLVREVGPITLDPCADVSEENWFAEENFSEDGLEISWKSNGVTYVNSPYGYELPKWAKKAEHEGGLIDVTSISQIILLCPARTDTRWWHILWYSAHAFCFWKGRIKFVGAPAGALFPSALFYWGWQPEKFCDVFEKAGIVGLLSEGG